MMPEPGTAIALLLTGATVAAAVLLAIAAMNDIATRAIPDFVPIGLIALGIGVRLADHDAAAALAASLVVFATGSLCWRQGWLGGGDVKLITACTWLVAPILVPKLILATALAGGCLATLYLAIGLAARQAQQGDVDTQRRRLLARIWRVEGWRIRRRASLPYGCAIAAATLFTMSSG
jgi:prepilin peptidase CpaA